MDYKRIVYESIYYRLETKPEKLERINAEVLAVCAFSDWNPIYYLDVSEMCFGMSLAVDWAGENLPKTTVSLAKQSLVEKVSYQVIMSNANVWAGSMGSITGTPAGNDQCLVFRRVNKIRLATFYGLQNHRDILRSETEMLPAIF